MPGLTLALITSSSYLAEPMIKRVEPCTRPNWHDFNLYLFGDFSDFPFVRLLWRAHGPTR